MRVLVISDTHGLLRPQVNELLGQADVVIHAGDVGSAAVLAQLQESTQRLIAVKGNVDMGAWAKSLPASAEVELEGARIFVLHNRDDLARYEIDADYVIFGHSHKALLEERGRQTLINPGSCGPRRFRLPITFGWLRLPEREWELITVAESVNR